MITKGFTDELKAVNSQSVIGSEKDDFLPSVLGKIDQHLDVPFRLYAQSPATSVLTIGASEVATGDGAVKSNSPAESALNLYPGATIDFQTGATTGGTLKTQSVAFALPTPSASNQFFRMLLSYSSLLNEVNTIFSPESATQAGLEDAGILAAAIGGQALGYLDLVSTNGTNPEFKTVGAATNVIESGEIHRFLGGAGGGGDDGGVIGKKTTADITLLDNQAMIVADFTIDTPHTVTVPSGACFHSLRSLTVKGELVVTGTGVAGSI